MKTIAIYNPKGGVGKTSLAVNLAYCASQLSARRTLLWDLDVLGGASFLLGVADRAPLRAKALFEDKADVVHAPIATRFDNLDIIAADPTLGGLDRMLFEIAKKKRLARILAHLHGAYDRVIIDCPAGQGLLADQIIRAANLVLMPVAPAPLAIRTVQHSLAWFAANADAPVLLLPILSMVDKKRPLHRDICAAHPDWPILPVSNLIERMGQKQAPLGSFAPNSAPQKTIASLWRAVERKLK